MRNMRSCACNTHSIQFRSIRTRCFFVKRSNRVAPRTSQICIARRTYHGSRSKEKQKQPKQDRSKPSPPVPDGKYQKKGEKKGNGDYIYTKAFGDAIMIGATHLASDRVPLDIQSTVIMVTVGSWWVVAGLRGDYTKKSIPSSMGMSMGYPVYTGLVNSLGTWVLTIPVILGIFSLMVSQNLIDAHLFIKSETQVRGAAPEMEVVVATLVTMCCWRGMHAGLRGP